MTLAQFIAGRAQCGHEGRNVDVFHSGSQTSSGPSILCVCVCEELEEAFSVMFKYNKTKKPPWKY